MSAPTDSAQILGVKKMPVSRYGGHDMWSLRVVEWDRETLEMLLAQLQAERIAHDGRIKNEAILFDEAESIFDGAPNTADAELLAMAHSIMESTTNAIAMEKAVT